jgi:hypothetical protein
MKSDHPVMNERDLIFEAQQAFYYGMPANSWVFADCLEIGMLSCNQGSRRCHVYERCRHWYGSPCW